jgi:hypothetical protein
VPLLDALLRPVLVHQHALVNGAGRAQHEGGGGASTAPVPRLEPVPLPCCAKPSSLLMCACSHQNDDDRQVARISGCNVPHLT